MTEHQYRYRGRSPALADSHERRYSTFTGASLPSRPLPSLRPVSSRVTKSKSEPAQLLGFLVQKLADMEERGEELDCELQYEYEHGDFSNKGKIKQLQSSKEKAAKREEEIFKKVILSLDTFLRDMILITNLFNNLYTPAMRMEQRSARDKYAKQIFSKYNLIERSMMNGEENGFIGLMFAGHSLRISEFKEVLQTIQRECQKQGITSSNCQKCEANVKAIERAFYKAYYVYRNDGYKQLKDVHRASLVFESFDDLYRALAVIAENKDVDILQIKDRFEPDTVPFGYRDVLIHFYCPGSKIICELQLHHRKFYAHKKRSHEIYKKARLFEQDDGRNLAYDYACKYVKPGIADGEDICSLSEDEKDECSPTPQSLTRYQNMPLPSLTPTPTPSPRAGTPHTPRKYAAANLQETEYKNCTTNTIQTSRNKMNMSQTWTTWTWTTPSTPDKPLHRLPARFSPSNQNVPTPSARPPPPRPSSSWQSVTTEQQQADMDEYKDGTTSGVQELRIKVPNKATPDKPLPKLRKRVPHGKQKSHEHSAAPQSSFSHKRSLSQSSTESSEPCQSVCSVYMLETINF